MDFWGWAAEHAFDLLSSVGIVGGLIFTAVSLRSETKTRRVANLLTLTQNHRDIWKTFFQNQDVSRVLDASADTITTPVNRAEEVFVNVLIQHLASVHRAMKDDLTVKPEGVRLDVRSFFTLPIPKVVWNKKRKLQNADFAKFVDACIAETDNQ